MAGNMRQDTVRTLDLDKTLSNKERFDKLKESRTKYKEEAVRQREETDRAKVQIEMLMRQLQMLTQQVEESDKSSSQNGNSAGKEKEANKAMELEIDSLRTRIDTVTAEMHRQKQLTWQATNAMHEKTMEASEWRKKFAAAEKKVAQFVATNGTGKQSEQSAASEGYSDGYSAYVYGALLGASAVAIIGYGALSVAMSSKR